MLPSPVEEHAPGSDPGWTRDASALAVAEAGGSGCVRKAAYSGYQGQRRCEPCRCVRSNPTKRRVLVVGCEKKNLRTSAVPCGVPGRMARRYVLTSLVVEDGMGWLIRHKHRVPSEQVPAAEQRLSVSVYRLRAQGRIPAVCRFRAGPHTCSPPLPCLSSPVTVCAAHRTQHSPSDPHTKDGYNSWFRCHKVYPDLAHIAWYERVAN